MNIYNNLNLTIFLGYVMASMSLVVPKTMHFNFVSNVLNIGPVFYLCLAQFNSTNLIIEFF